MCDTLIALPAATRDGVALFAKNSDRERNEAQFLVMVPAGRHGSGERLRATYITLPQAQHTHACLLSRPFWMWGAEMGANEHGVTVGNEAVHTIIPAERRRALIGMDLVRLSLERAASAADAVDVITTLLERHGQGGDCGHLGRFYYHNSFMIADPREAFVLETVGREWVLEKVEGVRAISNALSIGAGADAVSAGLLARGAAEGWLDAAGGVDFAAHLIDEPRDAASFGRGRCARATSRLSDGAGALTAAAMMSILRDHGAEADDNPAWRPTDTIGRSICMHAAEGARRSQTTASLVSELSEGAAIHWVTASAAPCLSLFKPVTFETGLPDQGPPPTDQFDAATRWWRHERLHRLALVDYPAAIAEIAPERDALQAGFIARMTASRAAGGAALHAAAAACWREADAAEARWLASLAARPRRRGLGHYGRSWTRLNRLAGMEGR